QNYRQVVDFKNLPKTLLLIFRLRSQQKVPQQLRALLRKMQKASVSGGFLLSHAIFQFISG
ncbi:hypothetical protein, partial [Chromobacterium sp. F49]|uniref:hypothetical protein n=1 Tax=Chromobacterium sp. F49 TaxID=1777131 RepID=UPI001E605FBB